MIIYFSVERLAGGGHKSPRYRARLHTEPGGLPKFVQAHSSPSVLAAKRSAEELFGINLDWTEPAGTEWPSEIRTVARLEFG